MLRSNPNIVLPHPLTPMVFWAAVPVIFIIGVIIWVQGSNRKRSLAIRSPAKTISSRARFVYLAEQFSIYGLFVAGLTIFLGDWQLFLGLFVASYLLSLIAVETMIIYGEAPKNVPHGRGSVSLRGTQYGPDAIAQSRQAIVGLTIGWCAVMAFFAFVTH